MDGGAFDGDKAYKDSKLCNVLFTRELSKRLKASGAKGVTVNCFSPGLITKSGLFRNREFGPWKHDRHAQSLDPERGLVVANHSDKHFFV